MTQSYLRARYYDTSTGRFLSEDPIKDGVNWYNYCANNPVNFADPTGTYYIKYENGYYQAYKSPWYANAGKVVASFSKVGTMIEYEIQGAVGVVGGTSAVTPDDGLKGFVTGEAMDIIKESGSKIAGKAVAVYGAYELANTAFTLASISFVDTTAFDLMNDGGVPT